MTRARLGLAMAVLAATVVPAALAADTAGADTPRERRVAVFTDSVGLGAKTAIPAAFPSDWEVNVDGEPARFVEQLEDDFVKYRLVTNPEWFGDHVVIAGGYNYPYWDPDRFERSVDSIIDTLTAAGVTNVYWVTLREVKPDYISGAAWRQVQPYYWYFPAVNEHLERALDRHPNLTLVDWAAAADRTGITYDAIHLNTTGAQLYASLIRAAVDTTPTRVAEGSVTRIPLPDPDGVTAVAVNLTTTQPRHRGYLTAYSCDDELPTVSNHNFLRDQTVAHATIVPIGPSGEICVRAHRATNLVVDLTGRFTGDVADTSPAERLVDTRLDGARIAAFEPVVVHVEPGPAAYTVTALGSDGRGWVRLAPCDSTTTTSNLNVNGPTPIPNAAVVAPDDNGTICLVASTDTHLLLDRLGPLSADTTEIGSGERLVDTRSGAQVPAGGVLRVGDLGFADPVGPDAGVLVNLTGLNAAGRGYVTAYGCDDGRPATSSLNVDAGSVVANLVAVAPDDDGELCLFSTVDLDLVIDLQARLTGRFIGDARRLLDTRT